MRLLPILLNDNGALSDRASHFIWVGLGLCFLILALVKSSFLPEYFFNDSLTDLYKNPYRKKDVWKVISENLDEFNLNSGT